MPGSSETFKNHSKRKDIVFSSLPLRGEGAQCAHWADEVEILRFCRNQQACTRRGVHCTSALPWLPLTRELSAKLTEGEILESPFSSFSLPPSKITDFCHLPRQREA